MLASLCFMLVFNYLTDGFLVPVAAEVQKAYKMQNIYPVTFTVIVWSVQAIPMTFVSMWLYNNFAYSNVLRLGSLLQITGAWIRSYAAVTGTFTPILIGTTIQSLSSCLLGQSGNLLANKWFPSNEYGTVSACCTLAHAALAGGFALAGAAFHDANQDTKEILNDYIFKLNIFGTIIFVLF